MECLYAKPLGRAITATAIDHQIVQYLVRSIVAMKLTLYEKSMGQKEGKSAMNYSENGVKAWKIQAFAPHDNYQQDIRKVGNTKTEVVEEEGQLHHHDSQRESCKLCAPRHYQYSKDERYDRTPQHSPSSGHDTHLATANQLTSR